MPQVEGRSLKPVVWMEELSPFSAGQQGNSLLLWSSRRIGSLQSAYVEHHSRCRGTATSIRLMGKTPRASFSGEAQDDGGKVKLERDVYCSIPCLNRELKLELPEKAA